MFSAFRDFVIKFLDSALKMVFVEGGENFVKLAYIIMDISAKHLRQLFKRKWDEKYPNQSWGSNDVSGSHLYSELSNEVVRCKSKEVYIEKWKSGNDHEWDTTTLVKVLLDSGLKLVQGCRSEGQRTDPLRDSEHINIIRNIRNGFFAHLPSMSCPNDDFIRVTTDIKKAAKNLFGEEVEDEILKIENSPVGNDMADQVEKLLEAAIKDFENDLNGRNFMGELVFCFLTSMKSLVFQYVALLVSSCYKNMEHYLLRQIAK